MTTSVQTVSTQPLFTTPNVPQIVGWFVGAIKEFQSRRRLLASVSKLSDRELRDFGMTRHDIFAATWRPLGIDHELELSIRAKSRARNW